MMKILNTTHDKPFHVGISGFGTLKEQPFKLADTVILYCLRGNAQVEIDMCGYRLEVGTCIILLEESMVRIDHTSDDFRVSYVAFSPVLFWEASTPIDPAFFGRLRDNPCVTLSPAHARSVKQFLAATSLCYRDKENRYRMTIIRNLIQCFLLDVYDKAQRRNQESPDVRNRQEELFKRFVQLVVRYCTREREVNFYAQKLCITPRYLSAVTRNVTGLSAKGFIDKHAVLEIKALLRSSSLSVQEIAYRFDFPNLSFFGRYFKKHTGVSPLQYRGSR